ncbi:MAG: class I SAM-dependent methyltransferase [Planctomycetaceae bacterium]|nr:class I SAM-dependent methyltransferase [Planctomycetaceae bacterium]
MDTCRKSRLPWQYDELKINSVFDYSAAQQAAQYEERHGKVRDIADENRRILDILERTLTSGLIGANILEIGTGTGAFARTAAQERARVTALDVSEAMLAVAKEKAMGISNIDFIHGGFLTGNFPESGFDAVVSSLALHHLPDVWKAEALANIYRTLKPGGVFILVDVVFMCEGGEMAWYVPQMLGRVNDEGMLNGLTGHIASEFSTLDWIMRGLIERAGMKIIQQENFSSVSEIYVAKK